MEIYMYVRKIIKGQTVLAAILFTLNMLYNNSRDKRVTTIASYST